MPLISWNFYLMDTDFTRPTVHVFYLLLKTSITLSFCFEFWAEFLKLAF